MLVLYKNDQFQFSENLKGSALQFQMQKVAFKLQMDVLGTSEAKNLWLVNGSIVNLDPQQIVSLSSHPRVHRIVPLNRWGKLLESVEKSKKYTYGMTKIKIPELSDLFPELSGHGVKVGIIDTGLDPQHPDLKGKLVLFKDYISGNTKPYDNNGHGTHVAGTIAGSSFSGTQIGAALDVRLYIAKTFSMFGNSKDEDLLLALQWLADPDGDPLTDDGVQVINGSWNVASNTPIMNPEDEPFCRAILNLEKMGIISVFAAGNDGPALSTIGVPGACPEAVTVAASDSEDQIAKMSSRGPVIWKGISLDKPNVAAPGVRIYSAAPDRDYKTKTGTSMAAPHVVGALALLIQSKPEASVSELKTAFYEGADDLGAPGFDSESGHGRVNVLRSFVAIPR